MSLLLFPLCHSWLDCQLFRDKLSSVPACSSALWAACEAMAMEIRASEDGLKEALKLKLSSFLGPLGPVRYMPLLPCPGESWFSPQTPPARCSWWHAVLVQIPKYNWNLGRIMWVHGNQWRRAENNWFESKHTAVKFGGIELMDHKVACEWVWWIELKGVASSLQLTETSINDEFSNNV